MSPIIVNLKCDTRVYKYLITYFVYEMLLKSNCNILFSFLFFVCWVYEYLAFPGKVPRIRRITYVNNNHLVAHSYVYAPGSF